MPVYNNPYVGQAISNIAQLFAPPSAGEIAAGAQIGLLNAKTASERQGAQRLSDFYGKITDPNTPRDVADRYGIGAGAFNPSQGYYSVDTQAATSRANNTADNARALTQTEMQQSGDTARALLAPVGPGATRFVPKSIGDLYDLPGEQVGVIEAQPGERIFTPGGQTYEGAAKPQTTDEVAAAILGRQSPQTQDAYIQRDIPVEEILGAGGKSQFVARPDAIGQQPAPKTPLVNIGPNGEPLGSPGEGRVWKRGPDGQPVFENGAPIAIPFQGGKVWQEQQDAAKQAGVQQTTTQRAGDIVLQDIDRALGLVGSSTLPTTGLIGDKLAGIPGTGARDVRGLVDTIRANIGFDKLQAMRMASPTGGALGNVTERELAYLQATMGNLEQSQSEQQFVDNMKRVKNTYLDIIHGPNAGPPREPLSFDQQPGVGGIQPAQGLDAAAIGSMSIDQLSKLDPATLSEDQRKAAEARWDALSGGGNGGQ